MPTKPQGVVSVSAADMAENDRRKREDAAADNQSMVSRVTSGPQAAGGVVNAQPGKVINLDSTQANK